MVLVRISRTILDNFLKDKLLAEINLHLSKSIYHYGLHETIKIESDKFNTIFIS